MVVVSHLFLFLRKNFRGGFGSCESNLPLFGTIYFPTAPRIFSQKSEIVIEEVPGITRVANGTYKVTWKVKDAWNAGFYIDVKTNKITKAHSKFYSVIKGKISNVVLKRVNTSQATLKFHYNRPMSSRNTGVKVQIKNKKIVVTKI